MKMTREHKILLSYVSDLIEELEQTIESKDDKIAELEERIKELEEIKENEL
jgi:hypothetical protein